MLLAHLFSILNRSRQVYCSKYNPRSFNADSSAARPDLFAAIDCDDDALQRMLAVIRYTSKLLSLRTCSNEADFWTVSVNLRHAKGKVVKPYSSSALKNNKARACADLSRRFCVCLSGPIRRARKSLTPLIDAQPWRTV